MPPQRSRRRSRITTTPVGNVYYAGRVLVAESLQMTEEVRTLLMAGTALGEVEKAALNSRALQPFSSYAAQLMARKMISASEALLAVSE